MEKIQSINFYKMHGIGNDYIYIDCISNDYDVAKIIPHIKQLSDRNFGIGGDGVVFISKSNVADCKMQMYNSDGSYSDMCGNALRCIAYLMHHLKLASNNLSIQTNSNIILAKILPNNRVEIAIKFNKNVDKTLKSIQALDRLFNYHFVDLGNPHAVINLGDEEVKGFNVEKYGKDICLNKDVFPNYTNVEFYKVVDNNTLEMRVWERGAGETLACGSGASAVAIVYLFNKNLLESALNNRVSVILKGGILDIEIKEDTILLTGGATLVYCGKVEISY